MKKIFFTLIFMGSFSSAFTQVTLTLDEYNGLKYKMDSLQKGWKRANDNLVSQEKTFTKQIDSLAAQTQKLKKEKNILLEEKRSLRKGNRTSLDENKILKNKIDSLTSNIEESSFNRETLESELNTKKEELDALRKQKRKSEQTEYKRGKQKVLKAVTASYAELSFDKMIEASSQKQVKRDLTLIVDDELKDNLNDLDIYFSAKQILTQKFDQQEVQSALNKAKNIKQKSPLVEDLIENLELYKLRSEGLKEAIDKIQAIDERFIANTDKDQKEKEADVLAQIGWYFYNYEINSFEDYPYLSEIIIEIMRIKHRDANKDISHFSKKL